jgi:3-oxoadipate enol-lactonase/4-carboxymuconolactone decarboxylase
VCWELPGHGRAPAARSAYRIEDLTDELVRQLGSTGSFHYAGASIGGCVGLDLCVRYPGRIQTATVISSGARVDDPALMRGRAVAARADGLEPFVDSFRGRWFAPTTSAETAERILGLLSTTDPESYALAAEALADFDVSKLLSRIRTPVLTVGGEEDEAVPLERSITLAGGIHNGVVTAIPHAAHSLVAEQPEALARAIVSFARCAHGAVPPDVVA